MMKSGNFIDNSNCTIRKECPFYQQDRYNKEDVFHYVDYCLKGGVSCIKKFNLERMIERRDK